MNELTFEQLPKAVTQLYGKLENIERLLLDNANEDKPQADQLLTIQQASELLNLSVPTIYGLVSRLEIPCMKKGKRLYFSQQELTNWVKTGRKKTLTEIASEAEAYLSNRKKKEGAR